MTAATNAGVPLLAFLLAIITEDEFPLTTFRGTSFFRISKCAIA